MPAIHETYIDNHILLVELDNQPANSLSKEMKRQFLKLLDRVEQETTLRAIIITGRGNKFCTGDDLKEAVKNLAKDHSIIINNLKKFSEIIDRFEALPVPIIAAINGWCVGGGVELALCADIRVAIPSSKFITAGVNVGLTASGIRLPRLIGVGRAKRMLLTGEAIDAQQAMDYGLITDIFDEEVLVSESIKMAQLMATKAPLAILSTKRIANKAFELSEEEAYLFQQEELEKLSRSQDHKEALTAFSEKRKPTFKGN